MRRENQHILLPHVQHVTYLRSSKDQGFKFPRFDGDFSRDAFLDLCDAAALVVRYLAIIGLVGAIVIHGARPEAAINFVARYDLFRFFGEEQQVMEAGWLQFYRKTPVEKELLSFVHEDDGRIGDQIAKVLGVGQAGAQGGKENITMKDIGQGIRERNTARWYCSGRRCGD